MPKKHKQTLYKARMKGSKRWITGYLAFQDSTGSYYMCPHTKGQREPQNKLYNIEVHDDFEKVE